MIIILIVLFLISLFFFIAMMSQRRIMSIFDSGNTITTGMRGRGKDMLFSFVTNRLVKTRIRNKIRCKGSRRSKKQYRQYVSNVDYTASVGYNRLKPDDFGLGGNTFNNFVTSSLKYYDFPYPDYTDFFLPDAGIYFPSQYQASLCKLYPEVPLFQALTRHLGKCNVHVNIQNLNRLWDKIREQADVYIRCTGCKVIGKFVFQSMCVYDRYESCQHRVKPFPIFAFMGKDVRMRQASYYATHGSISKVYLIHYLKNKYDDRIFKTMLLNGRRGV